MAPDIEIEARGEKHFDSQVVASISGSGVRDLDTPRTLWTGVRFDMICEANSIEHRLTIHNHLWESGQVKRMNRIIKDATVKRFH